MNYMTPERFISEKEFMASSDIFLTYFILTERKYQKPLHGATINLEEGKL